MAGRYTAATGRKDAAFCLDRANEICQPDGSTIYFGIDADTAVHDPQGVLDYLTEVNAALAPRFAIGCYAAGKICELALNRRLVTFTWVPEAPAWSGTREFMNSGKWTFYQNKTDMRKSDLSRGHGIEVDTDIVNPANSTIGAFDRAGNLVSYPKEDLDAIATMRMWVNQKETTLFDRPGGSKVGHMCIARMVRVISKVDANWVTIDI